MFKYIVLLCSFVAYEVAGHGMMLDPPNRSSVWRFYDSYPINYNDNEIFCGGIQAQWTENGGKCGVCGDNYAAPHPQPNENTGRYGNRKIVATYTAGQIIETSVLLTANHLGYFTFALCELEDENNVESDEECFEPLLYIDGSRRFPIRGTDTRVINHVKLPDGYVCNHCVLRWTYVGGNNWGQCEDGSLGMGCGPQETFRNCADIKIN